MTPLIFIIRVSQRPKDGADIAEAEHDRQPFRAVSRHGATMALARLLVAAGVPDGPWQAIGADGRPRFYGPSLYALALLTVAEDDDGLRLRRWTPRETVPVRPARSVASAAVELAALYGAVA